MSQRAYCTQHGLCYATFSYWRQRARPAASAAAPAFVPVVVEGWPAQQALAVSGEQARDRATGLCGAYARGGAGG